MSLLSNSIMDDDDFHSLNRVREALEVATTANGQGVFILPFKEAEDSNGAGPSRRPLDKVYSSVNDIYAQAHKVRNVIQSAK